MTQACEVASNSLRSTEESQTKLISRTFATERDEGPVDAKVSMGATALCGVVSEN